MATEGIKPPWADWSVEELRKEYEESLAGKERLIAYIQLLEAKLRIEGQKPQQTVQETK